MEESRTDRYIVDLAGVRDRRDLHARLAAALPLPAWYGANLDALYDALTDPGAGDYGQVLVAGCDDAERALKGYFRAFCRVCRAAQEENPGLSVVFLRGKE